MTPARALTWISSLLMSLALTHSHAATPSAKPIEHKPYTAIYQASYKGLPLQATHRLERAGNDWFFSSIASGFFGQIEENSTFDYTDTGIMPLHYNYLRSVLGHDKENELVYNQADKVVVSSRQDKSWTLPLKDNELDQGTYALALRDDVARGMKDVCYNVIEEDDVDHYCFKVTGEETIDTALGKLDTIVVERVRKEGSPRRTRFWLAPSLQYSIAKLEHREKEQTAYALEITYFRLDGNKEHAKTP